MKCNNDLWLWNQFKIKIFKKKHIRPYFLLHSLTETTSTNWPDLYWINSVLLEINIFALILRYVFFIHHYVAQICKNKPTFCKSNKKIPMGWMLLKDTKVQLNSVTFLVQCEILNDRCFYGNPCSNLIISPKKQTNRCHWIVCLRLFIYFNRIFISTATPLIHYLGSKLWEMLFSESILSYPKTTQTRNYLQKRTKQRLLYLTR